MNPSDFMAANSIVWPLVVTLIALLVFRTIQRLEAEVKPIVSGVIAGLATQSTRNAAAWSMGILIGSAASFQALAEGAERLGWVYVAFVAKVLQPGLVAIIGYLMNSPSQAAEARKSTGNTNPPIPIAQ